MLIFVIIITLKKSSLFYGTNWAGFGPVMALEIITLVCHYKVCHADFIKRVIYILYFPESEICQLFS